MATIIQLDQIETNDQLQARRYGLESTVVFEYAELMKAGHVFPPITVFFDGTKFWLADGFHRVEAARDVGAKEIAADVHEGTKRDALLHANGPANRDHGLHLTRLDKRNRVLNMLKDDEWSQWSNRQIAAHCGVSHTFVANLREEHALSESVLQRTAGNAKHWGLSNGMAFWTLVEKLRLDKVTVIERLQPGAKVLSDLDQTKDEVWSKLYHMGIRELAQLHPVDSHVIHLATKRVGRVISHGASPMGLIIKVWDLKLEAEDTWLYDGLARATAHEIEAYVRLSVNSSLDVVEEAARRFQPGDQVVTRTGHVGKVTTVNGGLVNVETVNGTKSHHPVDLKLVSGNVATADEPVNPFAIGDRVQRIGGRGNGVIRYIKGEKCGVYLDHSHTTHYYHWSELERETGNVATDGDGEPADDAQTADPYKIALKVVADALSGWSLDFLYEEYSDETADAITLHIASIASSLLAQADLTSEPLPI